MTCPDWLILSTPEKIMMLFSLFGILLLLNLLVFWRSGVSGNKSAGIDGINALVDYCSAFDMVDHNLLV